MSRHAWTVLLELVALALVVGYLAGAWRALMGRRLLVWLLVPMSLVGCAAAQANATETPWPFKVIIALVLVIGLAAAWEHDAVRAEGRLAELEPEGVLSPAQQAIEQAFECAEYRPAPGRALHVAGTHPPTLATPGDFVVLQESEPSSAPTMSARELQRALHQQADLLVQLTTQLVTHCDANGFGKSQKVFFASLQRAQALRDDVRPTPRTDAAPSHSIP